MCFKSAQITAQIGPHAWPQVSPVTWSGGKRPETLEQRSSQTLEKSWKQPSTLERPLRSGSQPSLPGTPQPHDLEPHRCKNTKLLPPPKAQCLKHLKPRFFKKHKSCQRLNKSAINQGGPSIIFSLSFPDSCFFFRPLRPSTPFGVLLLWGSLTAKLRGPTIFGSTLKVHTRRHRHTHTHTRSFITRVDGARAQREEKWRETHHCQTGMLLLLFAKHNVFFF